MSGFERGEPEPAGLTADQQSWWAGISVFDSLESAKGRAMGVGRQRRLGSFIAVLDVSETDPSLKYRQTGRNRHHFTLWGDPSAIRGRVISIVSVVDP
jgi:hypothetical protein